MNKLVCKLRELEERARAWDMVSRWDRMGYNTAVFNLGGDPDEVEGDLEEWADWQYRLMNSALTSMRENEARIAGIEQEAVAWLAYGLSVFGITWACQPASDQEIVGLYEQVCMRRREAGAIMFVGNNPDMDAFYACEQAGRIIGEHIPVNADGEVDVDRLYEGRDY